MVGVRKARGRIAAVVTIVMAVLAAVGSALLPAAAETVDAATPGLYAHTVTFTGWDDTTIRVEVGDGQLVPAPVLPTQAGEVFQGWWLVGGDGSEQDFNIRTDVVTGDITLRAHFETTQYLVEFMVPTASTAAGSSGYEVFYNVIMTAGENVAEKLTKTLGDTWLEDLNRNLDDLLPDNTYFTGQWMRDGTTDFDLTAPVDCDLTLYPSLENSFYAWFRSGGSVVPPQTVLDGDEVMPVDDPTNPGYDFRGWYTDENCAGIDTDTPACNSQLYDFTTAVHGNVILYGRWQAHDVSYTVVYRLEKPNIVPDGYSPHWEPGVSIAPPMCDGSPSCGALSEEQINDITNYEVVFSEVVDGVLPGSTVTAPTGASDAAAAAIQAVLDPAGSNPDPLYEYARSDGETTVKADGSTVVNVYFVRRLFQADFVLTAYTGTQQVTFQTANGSTIVNGAKVTNACADGSRCLGVYSIMVKVGLDVGALGVAPFTFDPGTGTFDPDTGTFGPGTGARLITGIPATLLFRGWVSKAPNAQPSNAFAVFTAQDASLAQASGDSVSRVIYTTGGWNSTAQTFGLQVYYVESLDQVLSAPSSPNDNGQSPTATVTSTVLASAVPCSRLYVDTLYGNAGPVVLDKYMDLLPSLTAWTTRSGTDRPLYTVTLEGFTPVFGFNNQPVSQWNSGATPPGFYQLPATGTIPSVKLIRYAFYTRNSYELSFDTMDGNPVTGTGPESIKYEAPLLGYKPLDDPVRPGAVFQGWYLDSDYTMPFDFATATMPAANLTLYAKWAVKVQFFSSDDAAGPIDGLTVTIPYGSPVAEPDGLTPRADGAVFRGWYFREASTGLLRPYDFSQPVTGCLRLYARWHLTLSTAGVIYDRDGGEGPLPADSTNYQPNNTVRLADGSTLVQDGTGAQFIGWTIGEDATLYYPGELLPVPAGGLELRAQYGAPAQLSQARFVENAGGTTPDVVWNGVVDAVVVWPDAEYLGFARPGYKFLGWSVNPSATSPEAAYEYLKQATLGEDITLFAVWEALPPADEPTSEPSSTIEPTTVKPPSSEPSSTIEPTVEPSSTIEPTSPSEPTTSESSSPIEPTGEPSSTIEPTTIEPTTVKPPTSEPSSTIEPTGEPSSTIEPTTIEPTTVKPPTSKPPSAAAETGGRTVPAPVALLPPALLVVGVLALLARARRQRA